MTEVRFNTQTERALTKCPCGLDVNLPTYGLSKHYCPCGRVWVGTPEEVGCYEPQAWAKARGRES